MRESFGSPKQTTTDVKHNSESLLSLYVTPIYTHTHTHTHTHHHTHTHTHTTQHTHIHTYIPFHPSPVLYICHIPSRQTLNLLFDPLCLSFSLSFICSFFIFFRPSHTNIYAHTHAHIHTHDTHTHLLIHTHTHTHTY